MFPPRLPASVGEGPSCGHCAVQVLHIDRNNYYGGQSASLNLNQVRSGAGAAQGPQPAVQAQAERQQSGSTRTRVDVAAQSTVARAQNTMAAWWCHSLLPAAESDQATAPERSHCSTADDRSGMMPSLSQCCCATCSPPPAAAVRAVPPRPAAATGAGAQP